MPHVMQTSWDFGLVTLSVVIAIIGSYIALFFAERLRSAQQPRARMAFTVLGAATMGLAIWSMHFIGMLALMMPMPVVYDPLLSFLSVFAAALGSGIAFFILQRPLIGLTSFAFGSVAMGLAIVSMHYIGMASMQMNAQIIYDPFLFSLSVMIAVLASAGALWLAFRPSMGSTASILNQKIGSAVLMGFAISGMHYTGMAAANYVHNAAPTSSDNISPMVGVIPLGDLLIIASVVFGFVLIVLSTQTYADRQKALNELRESEQRFRMMADSAPVLIWMAGTDTLCNYLNKVWLEFTGRTLEQEQGNGWADNVHPDDREQCLDTYLNNFHTRQEFRMEFRLKRADGQYRWILDNGCPLFNSDGTFRGFIGTCVDITERKEAEEILRQREEFLTEYATRLEHSNKELEHFAAIASHDLQAPLRKMMFFSERLKQFNTDNNQEFDETVERIQRSTAKMQDLISDLLTLSRVQQSAKSFASVEMNKIADQVIDELSSQIEQTGAEISVGDMCAIEADASQMHQLLLNLLENAIKFHQPDQVPTVKLFSENDGTVCIITVQDQGIGFKPEYANRIFQIFERLHGSGSTYPGTGIGLAIVHKIVERHQGQLEVESELGQGATFRIKLPLRQGLTPEVARLRVVKSF